MIGHRRAVKTSCDPDFYVPFFRGAPWRVESLWHDAHDTVQVGVEPEAPVQNMRVASERLLPETVADEDFERKTGRGIPGIEGAA